MKLLIIEVLMLMFLVVIGVCENDEDYIDPVIDMLLNGVSAENTNSTEVENVITGVIWKCGNCTNLGKANLVHTETNISDADDSVQEDVHVQISLEIADIRCVTVAAEKSGAVQQLLGTCNGSSVTLNVSPSQNFSIYVYT